MPNLKETKDRIQSVKNTQKITRAMKMVAAAKVKKAESSVKAGRPFTMELFRTFIEIYNSLPDKNFEEIKTNNPLENYPVLLSKREIKTIGLVLISSNKGLAGAYTANLIRYVAEKIKQANEKNIKVKIILIGGKAEAGIKALSKDYDFEIKNIYTEILDDIETNSVKLIAYDLAEDFTAGGIDKIELITTRYINMIRYKIESWTLLPVLNIKNADSFFKKEFNFENNVQYKTFFEGKTSTVEIFEPNQKALLKKILPMYIKNVIYQAILEAQASELASRMTAMSAATKNAEDMIKKLTVEYNKARQDSITQEIIEVVSGAVN